MRCIICGVELELPDGIVDTASCTQCSDLPGVAVIKSLIVALQKQGVKKEEIKEIIDAGIVTVKL